MTENSYLLFRPQEIVYIENNELRLFAEVIQTIPDRNRCWVKPLEDGAFQELLSSNRENRRAFRHRTITPELAQAAAFSTG